jgi:hypothetical protein
MRHCHSWLSPRAEFMPYHEVGGADSVEPDVVEDKKKTGHALLDHDDAMALLREEIEKAGSQSAWARLTGIHRTALSAALNGRKGLQPKIIAALGLRKVEAYVRI